MDNHITLLDFDGVYEKQSFYESKSHEWIDLQSLPNASLLCEQDTARVIYGKLREKKATPIHYLGSGNYHYTSYLLQYQIDRPYTLVLFDHHTDTLPSPSDNLITCGSWVLDALRSLPMLKKVFIIGVSEEAPEHIPQSIQDNVVYFTKSNLQSNLLSILKSIIKQIPTDSVYISIDKDVLDKNDAVTGWDHGTLRLKQLLKMLKAFILKKHVIGLDVCGEIPMNPTNVHQKEIKTAMKKNNFANAVILEYMNKWFSGQRESSKLLNA